MRTLDNGYVIESKDEKDKIYYLNLMTSEISFESHGTGGDQSYWSIKTWADNTTIAGNWCSFIEFGDVAIGVAHYGPTLYFRLFKSNKWFSIKGTAQES